MIIWIDVIGVEAEELALKCDNFSFSFSSRMFLFLFLVFFWQTLCLFVCLKFYFAGVFLLTFCSSCSYFSPVCLSVHLFVSISRAPGESCGSRIQIGLCLYFSPVCLSSAPFVYNWQFLTDILFSLDEMKLTLSRQLGVDERLRLADDIRHHVRMTLLVMTFAAWVLNG